MAIINHGAYEIIRGNYDDAVDLMLTSLQNLKLFLTADEDIHNTPDNRHMGFDFIHSKSTFFLRCPMMRLGQGHIPIFQQPFALQSVKGSISRNQAVSCSYIVMYNLALSYHLKYVSATEPNISHLHKAASLYECAHGVLTKEEISCSGVHLLVLINNLASIYRSLGDDDRAQSYLEHELVIFMYLVESGCVEELGSRLAGFTNMVLPHLIGKLHYAAAA
jgi:hypothetical protein